ncbi:MAG TPA: SDR family oxidoreductase [Chloroflexota bacterium]|jgi:NADP-dependent 3-hydroxy acid dehydrogenase YdfG|nr:SDR family oxidoreductase [Chloroflexota bacterium]
MNNRALEGQGALVTGASSGIGRATALALAGAGAAVALLARREAELRALAEEIERGPGTASVHAADLADGGATRAAVEAAGERLGRLDVVVYAAGTNIPRRSLQVLSPADWDTLLAANLSGAFAVTQAALPRMRRQGGGLLIYISSGAVQRPDVSGVAYQATKHGLVGLAHGTREEEREHGIRTTVIFPGLTETPLLQKRPAPTPPDVIARALQPQDVARACVFVATLPARARVPELQLLPSAL